MIIDSYENKKKILADFLQSCIFDGFSDETLKNSAKKVLGKETLIELVFENGCLDLIDFYIDEKNKETSKEIKKIEGFANFKIRDKIRTALYLRFESEIESKDQLQQLFTFYANPKNLCKAGKGIKPATRILKDFFKVADFIWYEIGDTSTDFNFYTKRVTLAKIIFRCLTIFIKDDKKLSETKNMIDLEIEKVMIFEKYKAKYKAKFEAKFEGLVKNSFINENGLVKSPKEIIGDLPFFRLRKK